MANCQLSIIDLLAGIPPARVQAIDLLQQFYGGDQPATITEIIERGANIEAAIKEAVDLSDRSQQAVRRCLNLKPVSTPKAPIGF